MIISEENYKIEMETLALFILIGSQISGTTSLSHQLSQHAEIDFCKHKEPDFFSKNDNWKDQIADYHSLYQPAPGKICGEGSTTYTWLLEYPDTALRIFEYNPEMKLIYIMRHPVERIVSHYTHHLLKARTKFSMEQEIFEVPTYIDHSRYAIQLRPYLELFPTKNILLLLFEDYTRDPLQTLYTIAKFLEIDPGGFDNIDLKPQYQSIDRTGDTKLKKMLTPLAQLLFPVKLRNSLRKPFVYQLDKKVEISDDLKKRLWRYVEDDVTALETIMGQSLDTWRKPPYTR